MSEGDDVYSRFAENLARTEGMSRSALNAYRDALLRRVVGFARVNSPFYRDRLAPLFRTGDTPDLQRWREVPILRRSDIERDIDRINPAKLPPDIGEVTIRRSSGTTGASGMTFRICALVRIADACLMQRLYHWWGYDDAAPMASIRHYTMNDRGFPNGKVEMQWSYPGRPAPHYSLDLRTSTANMIAWLVRHRPRYLLTFPSIAQELAGHPDARRIMELGLKGLVAISEIVSDDASELVRQTFGCEVAQIYGCSEMGAVALQSPDDGTLLVCEENVMVELIDDYDQPVRAGETGRVILTSLYNFATPFIRYEIGDYATSADGTSPSDRAFIRLQRIEGRQRNALVTASGKRVWQSAIPAASLLRYVAATQFQIRQPAADLIEFLYVPANTKPADHAGLATYFASLLGCPVTLTLSAVDAMPRTTGGKYERIVSAVAA
jgi:phenylacetate-coenzyme A ligase PaaK-like adenylate-forming protein